MNNRNERVYGLYQVFFRKNGDKKFVFANTRAEANRRRDTLIRNHRKFLGMRRVELAEVR